MKKRVFGLDFIRVVAFYFVILVHSFLNSSFNHAPLEGFSMFLLLMVRCVAFTGVLLFIMITGYCKSNKELSKEHFRSIIKILVVYLVISIITFVFRKFYLHQDLSFYNSIIGIFNFTTIPYAWYVEMYIGLFLLIPFLNIVYHHLDTKEKKQLLIFILLFITSISTTFSNLEIAGRSLDVLPNWWGNLYPILLYYIGSYIKEYSIKLNKIINFIIIIVLVFLQAFIMYYYCHGLALYDRNIFVYENNLPSIILAVFIFLFCYDIKTHSKFLTKIMYLISYASFGGYLISYCCDQFFYHHSIPLSPNQPYYFLICTFGLTPIIFFSSTILSYIINKMVDIGTKIHHKIHNNHQLKVKNKEVY